ncbi:MAG: 6-hydroxymethylpterin diphosphokinase MptE-like protein [Nostocaceae cyanobacterium]|nr:6-hydroxymethylpterin diphosphokinase MptE-like protein [Nostocaceae cyanobacterium]
MKAQGGLMFTDKFFWRYWYYSVEKYLYNNSNEPDRIKELLKYLKPEPLLIVCNGPSLNNTPLEKFNFVQSIGLNKIHLIFDKTTWRPDLVLCMNRHVVCDWQDSFLSSGIPTGLAWQTRYRVRQENRKKFTYFLNQYRGHFGDSISSGLDTGATVTYAALQFAYYAGADPVVIVGLDHKFETQGKANKLITSKNADSNHFDPRYFGPGIRWNLPDLKGSEKVFQIARQTFEKDNRNIYDATINGNLKIFNKISIDEAVELCRR